MPFLFCSLHCCSWIADKWVESVRSRSQFEKRSETWPGRHLFRSMKQLLIFCPQPGSREQTGNGMKLPGPPPVTHFFQRDSSCQRFPQVSRTAPPLSGHVHRPVRDVSHPHHLSDFLLGRKRPTPEPICAASDLGYNRKAYICCLSQLLRALSHGVQAHEDGHLYNPFRREDGVAIDLPCVWLRAVIQAWMEASIQGAK